MSSLARRRRDIFGDFSRISLWMLVVSRGGARVARTGPITRGEIERKIDKEDEKERKRPRPRSPTF